jgi:hypothetical protein
LGSWVLGFLGSWVLGFLGSGFVGSGFVGSGFVFHGFIVAVFGGSLRGLVYAVLVVPAFVIHDSLSYMTKTNSLLCAVGSQKQHTKTASLPFSCKRNTGTNNSTET